MAFIGFLYLEYTYNNAVVNMFVKLMTDAVSMHDENGYVTPTEEAEATLLQPQRKSSKCSEMFLFTKKPQNCVLVPRPPTQLLLLAEGPKASGFPSLFLGSIQLHFIYCKVFTIL